MHHERGKEGCERSKGRGPKNIKDNLGHGPVFISPRKKKQTLEPSEKKRKLEME